MPKISVIMPCLNVANYLEQCLDTVIHQTLEDMEILIVDAGSTDGTMEILNRYAKKDSRIRVFHSKKKSYGYQMNLGISMATGEYIGIVETDDMIQLDMFEALYKKAVDSEADYVKGTSEGFYRWADGKEWTFPIIPCKEFSMNGECIVVPKEIPSVFLYDNFLWNGIYRREFIQKIRFHETQGAAFQDIGVLFQIASTASKGVYIDHLVYHYRQDNLDASSYNKKGLSYAAVEYQYLEPFLQKLPVEWHKSYYLKMAGLTIDRFYIMAASGEYWEESHEKIEELRKRVNYAVNHQLISEEDCDVWQRSLWQNVCLFLEGSEEFYRYVRDQYEEKLNTLQELYKVVYQHKVYIFGAKKPGQFLHLVLEQWGMNQVEGYCDNNSALQGKMVQTKRVFSPEEAVTRDAEAYYVITSVLHMEEMKHQLMQLGVREEFIKIYHPEMDMRFLRERFVI